MPRETREVWAKRVERWVDSGLSAKEYAAETGVNANTLAHWRWRLGKAEGGRRRPPGPAFLEIVRSPEPAPADAGPLERLEVVLRSGLRVLVPPRFDGDALRRLVDALEVR